MASTYLKRTNGTPTNDKIGTISVWVKRSKLGTDQRIHMNFADGSNYAYLRFTEGDLIEVYGVASGSQSTQIRTNRKFRDTNAWYHIVLAIDTTQGTSTDRIKIYVNGVQETSMGTTDYWGQNETCQLLIASGSNYHTVGSAENGSSSFDGSMSHYHKCDGTALAPTVFGSTDSTTGEWKINTSPSFTVGNTGYTILKDGNTITDQSSNSNDFTLGAGTLTKTESSPSNVFATLDPLNVPTSNAPTFSNGNTKVVTSSGGQFGGSSNLGASSGKYYFEIKFSAGTTTYGNINFVSSSNARETARQNVHANQLSSAYPSFCYEYDGNVYKDSTSTVANYGTYAVGDIIMIAADLDNQFAYFGVNGTWGNSSVPTSGATGTGGASMSANPDFWHLALGDRNSSGTNTYEVNFGNGYFGTTAVSSAGANASGNGIFEYDVPTGYTALSTKGLNL
jgi:hypothetical protein